MRSADDNHCLQNGYGQIFILKGEETNTSEKQQQEG
jgi:hypothetical protein